MQGLSTVQQGAFTSAFLSDFIEFSLKQFHVFLGQVLYTPKFHVFHIVFPLPLYIVFTLQRYVLGLEKEKLLYVSKTDSRK
jgi:hypothetical protein